MGEDVIGGRCPSWQAMVSVKNFHRSRPGPSAARGHAGRIVRRYDIAGQAFNSGLCRVPDLERLDLADDEALVFTSPMGTPLRHSNFYRRAWMPAVAKVGLPGIHFYDLRHAGEYPHRR